MAGRARFRDRTEAGTVLGRFLVESGAAPAAPAVVLGLARGGVPVAAPVADRLGLPLDVLVVRKLGVPGHEELAMGAVAGAGILVLNDDVVRHLRIPPEVIDRVARAERELMKERLRCYRPDRDGVDLNGLNVVLVDDGLATGSTMLAAIRAVQTQGAASAVVAVPVASSVAVGRLRGPAVEVACPLIVEDFRAVGWWYDRFEQVADDDVRALLKWPGAPNRGRQRPMTTQDEGNGAQGGTSPEETPAPDDGLTPDQMSSPPEEGSGDTDGARVEPNQDRLDELEGRIDDNRSRLLDEGVPASQQEEPEDDQAFVQTGDHDRDQPVDDTIAPPG